MPIAKALSVDDAAHRICDMGGWKVTNLALQKILYLLQMIHMGENEGARLIDADFEAWDFGPVIPELYHNVKMFGSQPIQNVFFTHGGSINREQERIITENAPWLLKQSPGQLVAITHWNAGAWAKNYRRGRRNVLIPSSDIIEEFQKRTVRAQKKQAAAVSV